MPDLSINGYVYSGIEKVQIPKLDGSGNAEFKIPKVSEIEITKNGTYNPPEDVDGFGPVIVNIATQGSTDAPVIESLDITENGTYTAPSGVDGYSPITVNVPTSGGNSLNATVIERGSYTPTVSERRIELTIPPEANAVWMEMASFSNRDTFDVTQLPARGFIGAFLKRDTPYRYRFMYSTNYNSSTVIYEDKGFSAATVSGEPTWSEDGSIVWTGMQSGGAASNVVAGETYNWVAMII